MIDKRRLWKVVALSWIFTLISIFNMLVITAIVSFFAFRFIGNVATISILASVVILSLLFFLLSEVIINIIMGAKKVDYQKYGDFVDVVDEIYRENKMWFRPRLFILSLGVPNAMAYGWGFLGQCAVAITPELYQELNREELKAVVAHEIAHTRCRDVGVITAISMLTGGIDKLKNLFFKGKTVLGRGPFAFIFGGILWFLSKFVFSFLRAAISQERELAADALGSLYVGTPDSLISALRKLEKLHPKKESDSMFNDLFISHPKMSERIASLESLKKGEKND